jgi:hypothetical protein
MNLWTGLFPVGRHRENQLRTLAMNENQKPKEKSRLWTIDSPDYYGVVVVTNPYDQNRDVLIVPPDAALCIADILRDPSAVVAFEAQLRQIALSQRGKSVAVCEREVNMLALTVDREKPSRLDS